MEVAVMSDVLNWLMAQNILDGGEVGGSTGVQ